MHGSLAADQAAAGPRRSRAALIAPVVVALLTAGVLGWTAWPTLRPVRTVGVVQAVFDRGTGQQPTAVAGDAAGRAAESAAGSGKAVQAPGWLEAEPFLVACTALADGVVESIEVLEGDRVEAGQVVARLVAEDAELRLARAEAELAAAESRALVAQAELDAATTDWQEPVERERAVESGHAALAEAEAELDQLPALIASARATLVGLEEELERARASRAGSAATELEVIVARQRALAQASNVTSLEARGPLLRARVDRLASELRAAERALDLRVSERRRLAASQAGMAEARAGVLGARVMRDEAALELERMTIRSPISGFVQKRLKVPGDKVIRMMDSPHSAHLVHLYDPERLQVRVDVPLAEASHVFVGQRCEVVVEVLPDRTFAGEVLRVTHEADLQKNTLQVKVKVIDPSPVLRPEMLTRVRFLPDGESPGSSGASAAGGTDRVQPATDELSVVLIPTSAIQRDGNGPRVWTVRDRRGSRGVLEPVLVKPLVTPLREQPGSAIDSASGTTGWTRVRAALSPGAWLVEDPGLGGGELRAGEVVRVSSGSRPPAMTETAGHGLVGSERSLAIGGRS